MLTLGFSLLPPLFALMQGTWIGEGERVQLVSAHRVSIATRSIATIQGDRLLSHNEFTEVSEEGTRSYVRDYWLEPEAEGRYAVGTQAPALAIGRFDGVSFELSQDLGGGYVSRSRTRFDEQGSVFEEVFSHGNDKLSTTVIRYHR